MIELFAMLSSGLRAGPRSPFRVATSVLAGALLVASMAVATPAPERARSTRPSSSAEGGGSVSGGTSTRVGGGHQASPSTRSSGTPRGPAGVSRPPAGGEGGAVRRPPRQPSEGVIVVSPRFDPWFWYGFGWYGYGAYFSPWYGGWWLGHTYYPPGGYHDRRDGDYRVAAEPGAIHVDARPRDAEIWIEGEVVGLADEFDGFPDYLWLPPGSYRLAVYLDGYRTETRDVRVESGTVVRLRLRMERGPSTPPSSPERGDESWRDR